MLPSNHTLPFPVCLVDPTGQRNDGGNGIAVQTRSFSDLSDERLELPLDPLLLAEARAPATALMAEAVE